MMPARPPPIAEAPDRPRSCALPDASLSIAIRQGTPPPVEIFAAHGVARAFGATISTSRSARGSIRLKCTLRPWANRSAAPSFMLPCRCSR